MMVALRVFPRAEPRAPSKVGYLGDSMAASSVYGLAASRERSLVDSTVAPRVASSGFQSAGSKACLTVLLSAA